MTKINKLVMTGFKSFVKRTELLFDDGFNCCLGPNGSGKCVDGDTLVYLADGSLVPIRELVNEKLKTNSQILDDGYVSYDDSLEVLALDTNTLKVVKRNVQAFVKRKSPDALLKMKTRSGREIIATEYHPLFILKDNAVQAVKAEELREGIRIAVPRQIHIKPETPYFYELLDLITPGDNLYAPWDQRYSQILRTIKQKSPLKNIAEKLDVPLNALKGLLDKQAINFAYLVRILRCHNLNDREIIALIPRIKSKNYSITYPIPWKNSLAFARLLGYLLAEGRLPPMSDQIWFTNGDEEIIADYVACMKEVFGIAPSVNEYKSGCWDVLAYSSPLRIVLNKFGMATGGTKHKTISNLFLTHSSADELANLLNGLYSGDGYVSNRSIEITTKSENLAIGVQTILTRFGISYRVSDVIKIATNSGFSGNYKFITIYGVDNIKIFHSFVRLTHKGKQGRIENLLHLKSNPNVDLIEANTLVKDIARELSINVKQLRKQFPRLDAYCYNQCLPSTNGLKILLKELFMPMSESKNRQVASLQKLQLLAHADIIWDEVVEIEKIEPKEPWVYDLCVDKDHNFIANNIFVHNSNVMDAICFVLGKASAKALRAERLTSFIYNGGKTKQPAKQAEVSIFFDNSKKIFPTEDKEVKITRIARHNGQSLYKINDKVRTRQEILELLSIAKVDPDGYNIILQGDIVRFTEMPSIERRQLIEEIAGISIYEEKKQKALRELEKVEERIREAEILLKEKQANLNELKKDRDQALKFKEMNDKIRQHQASFLKLQIDKKEHERNELQKKIDDLQKELEKINKEISGLQVENLEKRKQIEQITLEIEQKGEKEQVDLNRDLGNIKVDIAKQQSRLEVCKSEIEKIKTRKIDLDNSIKSARARIEQLKKEKTDLEKKKSIEAKSLAEYEDKIKTFKEKNKIEDAANIDKEILELEKSLEESEKQVALMREEQHNLLREKDRTDFQLKTIDEKIKKVEEVEKENKEKFDQIKKKQEEFKKSTLELNKILDEDATLAKTLHSSKDKLDNLRDEVSKLIAKSVGIQESISSDIAVREILNQKNRIKGIYGQVAELGQVNTKYSLALEIAAGPRIKSIVVEDDKVAAECIKYLKANKLGTATFMPLNKLEARETKKEITELAKAKGSHGLAIDLVTFDPKFKRIFNYIFASTIIVDSIDTARRLGIGSAKMVTLDGDLTELSGIMQGGYRQKKLGSFKDKNLSEEVEKKKQELENLEKNIDDIEKRRDSIEKRIEHLRQFKANLEGDIIKAEKVLHLEAGDVEVSRKQKDELNKLSANLDKKLRELTDKLSAINKQIASGKIKRQELRAKVINIRDPVQLAELRTFEEKKAQLYELTIKIDSDIKNIDLQINSLYEPEIEKADKILKQISKEEVQFTTESANLDKSIKDKNNELKQKEAHLKEFSSKYRALFEKRKKLEDEIHKNDLKVNSKQPNSREVEIKMNNLTFQRAEIMGKLAGMNEEFEQYHGLKIIPDKTEEQLKSEISKFERLKADIERGGVNMKALEIYDSVEKQYNELVDKKEKLLVEKNDVLKMMDEIEGRKKELFMKTLNVVDENFKRIFNMLSSKGEANLELENPDKPFEAGLQIKVRTSGNKFMDIRGLSGGEKTLTALSFIFSIQEHEPASFYILDEVDAALDRHNSEKFSKLIGKYSENAQYIIISHNDSVVTEANSLYGVSMDENGISNVVSLKI